MGRIEIDTMGADSARRAGETRARLRAEIEHEFAADPPVTRDLLESAGRVSRETSGSARSTSVSRETRAAIATQRVALRDVRSADSGIGEAVRSARVIAIANQKGGVGKTTTAVNLAACLAAAEQRTLIVDLDPQGNASSGLGIAKDALANTIYNVLIDDLPLEQAIVRTTIEYLDIAPASVDLFGAEIELVNAIGREHRLRGALEGPRSAYDYILVDCPPSLGLLTVNALTAVDAVLIPIQCEYYALEGLSQLLGTLRIVQKNLNPALQIEGVLLTMFDARLNLARQVRDEAMEYFGDRVYETVIPRNVRLSEAPSFGKPVILYDILSSGAESYMKLAEEMIKRCPPRHAHGSAKG